jgi:hypothetical protein
MLPDFIVIGAMKSGTTSLHRYLDLHPQISMSQPKELDFFVSERNWPKGVEWYKSNFAGEARVFGEVSPNYTKRHIFEGVPERMYSIVPETKLIYILRDPIARIVSHYTHSHRKGIEKRSISAALTGLKNNHYVLCSKYYMQLEPYLSYFPKDATLIITLEDLSRHRQQTLQKVFRFLEVDSSLYDCDQNTSRVLYRSSDKRRRNWVRAIGSRLPGKKSVKMLLPFPSYFAMIYDLLSHSKVKKPALSEKLRRELILHLQEDADRLREYTGYAFEEWSL